MSDNKSEIKREKFIVLLSICIVLAVALAATLVWTAMTRPDDPPETEPPTDAPTVTESQTDTEPPETLPTPGAQYAAVAGSDLWNTYLARLVKQSDGGKYPSGIVIPNAEDEALWFAEKFYAGDEKTYSDGTYTYMVSGNSITVIKSGDDKDELHYTGANEYEKSPHYVSTDGEEIGKFVTAKDINFIGGKLVVIRQVDRVVRVGLPQAVVEILNEDNLAADSAKPETDAETDAVTDAATDVVSPETDDSAESTADENEAKKQTHVYTAADTVTVVQSYTYVEMYTVSDGIPELDSTHIISGAYDGFDYNAVAKSYQVYCDYDVFGGDMTAFDQYIPFYVTPDGNKQLFEAERIQPADAAAAAATYAGADVVAVVRITQSGAVDDYMAVYQIGYTTPALAIAAGE